jgi:hypothetical protein
VREREAAASAGGVSLVSTDLPSLYRTHEGADSGRGSTTPPRDGTAALQPSTYARAAVEGIGQRTHEAPRENSGSCVTFLFPCPVRGPRTMHREWVHPASVQPSTLPALAGIELHSAFSIPQSSARHTPAPPVQIGHPPSSSSGPRLIASSLIQPSCIPPCASLRGSSPLPA